MINSNRSELFGNNLFSILLKYICNVKMALWGEIVTRTTLDIIEIIRRARRKRLENASYVLKDETFFDDKLQTNLDQTIESDAAPLQQDKPYYPTSCVSSGILEVASK